MVTIPPGTPRRSSRQSSGGFSSGKLNRPSIMRNCTDSPRRPHASATARHAGTAPAKATASSTPIVTLPGYVDVVRRSFYHSLTLSRPEAFVSLLDRYFRLSENGTTVRTEVIGGLTTFATMAYIIVANPAILSAAGFPIPPSTVATILVAVFGCLLMGLYANRPFAVAPYMGENAFIAFGLATFVVNGSPVTWQMRLGAVFVSGVAF